MVISLHSDQNISSPIFGYLLEIFSSAELFSCTVWVILYFYVVHVMPLLFSKRTLTVYLPQVYMYVAICTFLYVRCYMYVAICTLLYYVSICMLLYLCCYMFVAICTLLYVRFYKCVTICTLPYVRFYMYVGISTLV